MSPCGRGGGWIESPNKRVASPHGGSKRSEKNCSQKACTSVMFSKILAVRGTTHGNMDGGAGDVTCGSRAAGLVVNNGQAVALGGQLQVDEILAGL
jgi:hypothetical protein